MSPILVRPVREQLEHDRVIRLLQAKYKRKFEVAINPGNEQTMPVGGNGAAPWFPDLVLQSQERARKLLGIVEVETTESVNHLEAMSQWVAFSKFKAAFHLYVPTGCVDNARRLSTELNVEIAELWAYQSVGDQIRFMLIQRSAAAEKARAAESAEKPKPAAAKPVAAKPATAPRAAGRNGAVARPAARAARRAAPVPAVRRKTTAKAAKPAAQRTVAAKASARKAATTGSRSPKRR